MDEPIILSAKGLNLYYGTTRALKDVEMAAKVFCTCLKLATLEKQGK